MRRLIAIILFGGMLSGCTFRSEKPKVVDIKGNIIKNLGFNKEEAKMLLEDIERPINELKSKETIDRESYEVLKEELREQYPYDKIHDILGKIVDRQDHEGSKEVKIRKDTFYPTIYDDGVEIVQAYIEKSNYREDMGKEPSNNEKGIHDELDKNRELSHKETALEENRTIEKKPSKEEKEYLVIEVNYKGQDETLAGFSRVYKFRLDETGKWKLEYIR